MTDHYEDRPVERTPNHKHPHFAYHSYFALVTGRPFRRPRLMGGAMLAAALACAGLNTLLMMVSRQYSWHLFLGMGLCLVPGAWLTVIGDPVVQATGLRTTGAKIGLAVTFLVGLGVAFGSAVGVAQGLDMQPL